MVSFIFYNYPYSKTMSGLREILTINSIPQHILKGHVFMLITFFPLELR